MPTQVVKRDSTTRRPVNLSIDPSVVAEARVLTPNLSATVEHLLGMFVAQEKGRRHAEQEQLDRVIDALNEFHEEHGFLSETFPSF